MQDKQKVTFYLPERLHHQLKIRSAIDGDSMSDLAEKAISFYLAHADIVQSSGVGHIHQTYNCPSCSQTVVIRNGEMLAIGGGHTQILPVQPVKVSSKSDSSKSVNADEELIPVG